MTGGEPPLPPPRASYPPWQGRPYRRRGGPPAPPRSAWVGRRPRSPPPSSRPRQIRGAPPHRHHRHVPYPHASSQSHPHHTNYHNNAPPPLSRSLQGRLRSPPRTPPPRRSDLPLHRDDALRGDPHQTDRERLDQRRLDHSRPDSLRLDPRRSPSPSGSLRPDIQRPDSHRPDSSRLDSHRHDPHRPDQRPTDPPRPDQHHHTDHPYRGKPGPSHRIDSPDRPAYRPEPYGSSRPPPQKSRTESGPPRSEHRPHRGPSEHHIPYRGVPGPFYRADLPPHRDELDSRRQATEPGLGRGEPPYGPWFRHTSRIHKPLKRKIRRHVPLGGTNRGMPSKPESPILSRMGFTQAERGSTALRTDASAPSSLPSTKPSANFPSTKWQTEALPRFHAKSPRPSEFDATAQTERAQRPLGSGSTPQFPGKKKPIPPAGYGDWSRSPAADSFSNKSTAAGGRTSNDERPNGEARTSTSTQCNGAMASDGSGTQWERGNSVRDLPIPVERIRRFGKSTAHEFKSLSTERNSNQAIGKRTSGGLVDGNSFPLSEKQNVPSKSRTDAPIGKARIASQKPSQRISRDRAITNMSLADRNPAAALKREPSSHFSRGFVERKTILTSEAARKVPYTAKSRQGSEETAAMVSSQTKRHVQPLTLENADVGVAANDEDISANSKSLPDGTEVSKESKVWKEGLQSLSKLLNPRAASPKRMPLRERATPPASTPPPPPKPKTQSIPVLTGTKPLEPATISTGDSRSTPQTPVRALHASRSHVSDDEPAVTQHKASDVRKGVLAEKVETKPERLKPASGSPPQEKKSTERHSPLLKAPAFPSLNLRSILSSGLTSSSTAVGKPVTSPDPLPDLRSLLRPVTSTTDPKRHPSEADSGASRHGPVSVPASAMSLLRSSPRARARENDAEGSSKQLSSLSLPRSAVWKYLEPTTQLGKGMPESDSLIQAIHGIDKRITEVERKLIPLRTFKSMSSVKVEASPERIPAAITKNDDLGTIFAIAKQIAASADLRDDFRPTVSTDPSQAALRLIVVQNHAKAAAASAALRPVCSHPDRGLQSIKEDYQTTLPVSAKVFAAVSCEVRKRKIEADARTRALRREYVSLRDSWLRKLKSARDKKSREKREATKERDRFLVLRTKGHSALLTSRTSSGRTSTKLFPSLSANGHLNSNTEVDALLAEIAAAGGTPGSKDIWSKTLAEIPDQNCSFVPCDNGSVFVEDPIADFTASRHVNPWYLKEKLVFLEKFIVYSKNFRKIASFLEHKSTRECSQFYYMNKLDLGLKQLAKESSGMKRKGILRSHIVNLAKKRLCFESDEVVEEQTRAFLSANSLVISSSFDRGHSSELMDLGGSRGNAHIDKAQLQSMKMMFKKRIMGEYGKLDVSDIDIQKFSRVIAMYGTDWKKVSAEMEVQGKSSTHYREFYRKNRRKLRQGLDNSSYPRLTVLPRSQSPSLRQSPRSSPQASPRSSPSSSHRRLRRNMSAREIDELALTHAVELSEHSPSASTATHVKDSSPAAQNSTHQVQISSMEHRTANDANRRRDGETESRKSKTSTWTSEEGEQFRQLFKRYGRDWKRIAHLMSPKTPTQVKGYWKKVAHEVGNGLPSDSTKTKGEKKRPRRSASVDELAGEETNDLERSSEKRSASLKHIGASHSDYDRREAKRQRQNGPSVFPKEVTNSPSEKVCEGKSRTSVASPNLEDSSRANGAINEYHPNGTESNEETDSKIEGRKTLDMKFPSLRSTPVPVFRSIPAVKLGVEGSGGEKGRRGDVAVLGGARNEGERGSENGPRQAELRRTAESYGVLAHLGARLDDASHGQKGKR